MARKNPIISLFKDLVNLGLESFGKYYSIYRGYVYDRNDPLNLGRVQLVIPQVTGNAPYKYWAMPINVFSGKNYGSQVLPKKGDLVWVQFEGGHPEVPIWSHGHFGKGEIPNDPDLQDKDSYWFLSPKGHLVILNDTKNYIKVKSLLGDRLELNEKGIYVSATKGKKIFVENDKTSLKAIMMKLIITYMKTKTISGDILDPTSQQNATDVIKLLNQLM